MSFRAPVPLPVSVPACTGISPSLGCRALPAASANCYASASRSPSPAPSTCSGGSRSSALSALSDASASYARSATPSPPHCGHGMHWHQCQSPRMQPLPRSTASRSPSFGSGGEGATPRGSVSLTSGVAPGGGTRQIQASAVATARSILEANGLRSSQASMPTLSPPSGLGCLAPNPPPVRSVRAFVADIEERLRSHSIRAPPGRLQGASVRAPPGRRSSEPPGAREVEQPKSVFPMQSRSRRRSPPLMERRRPPVVATGDVLVVRGSGYAAQIGTTGGFMGHVLMALGPARVLDAPSVAAQELHDTCPALRHARIWCMETLESTRQVEGLHRSEMLFRVDPFTGRILIVGELDSSGGRARELSIVDEEEMELWQSPPEVRSQLRGHLVSEVLSDMKASEQNWSLATAAWAVLKSAPVHARGDSSHLLQELQDCWGTAPICTSIVIVFWQRYLCLLAAAVGQSQIDLILRVMPLKADRGLPGDLVGAMRRCGWVVVDRLMEERLQECSVV